MLIDGFGKELKENDLVVFVYHDNLLRGKILSIDIKMTDNDDDDNCLLARVKIAVTAKPLHIYMTNIDTVEVSAWENFSGHVLTGQCRLSDSYKL